MVSEVLVGFSEVDITPPAPVTLEGQFHTRLATHVASRLQASVMALQGKNDAVIICALDLLMVLRGFTEQVKAIIKAEAADLPLEKIIFTATHTHTAPTYYKKLDSLHVAARFLPQQTIFLSGDEDLPADVWDKTKCGDYIAAQTAQAVLKAWRQRQPACLGPAFGRAVIGHNRRSVYTDGRALMNGSPEDVNFVSLESGNDSGVELLYIFSQARKPLGVLVNVACPAQAVGGESFISADFWGKARDLIKAELGPDFVVLGLCGAAGDQLPRDLIRRSKQRKSSSEPSMHTPAGLQVIAQRLAGVVLDKIKDGLAELAEQIHLSHQILELDFPLRRVSWQEKEKAAAAFADYVANSGKRIFDYKDISLLHESGGVLERFQEQQKEFFYSSEIHVVRIADLALATNPFELFLDYGNQIKALSPAAQTFIIQLSCDYGGYLPTKKAEIGGHYSAYVSSGRIGHAGGELLVQRTVAGLDQLWLENRPEKSLEPK